MMNKEDGVIVYHGLLPRITTELFAKWVYKGDVSYTEFYDSEYVSKFKEALCYEIFPFGLPVVLSDGEYSR